MTAKRRVSAKDLPKVAICDRCRRRPGKRDLDRWNAVFRDGVVVGFLCPDCQTPEESTEAEINEATIDYGKPISLSDGRLAHRDPFGGDHPALCRLRAGHHDGDRLTGRSRSA